MEELIEFVAKSLVDDAEAVNAHAYNRGDQTVIELEVARTTSQGDRPPGPDSAAMRTLLAAAGQKTRRRYTLDIVD